MTGMLSAFPLLSDSLDFKSVFFLKFLFQQQCSNLAADVSLSIGAEFEGFKEYLQVGFEDSLNEAG